MKRRSKRQVARIAETPPLEIQTAEGQTLLTFPGETIRPLRRLLTQLAQQGDLPARISVIAALRQEGVSHLSLALAATMAHDLAIRVCAVELNWWWPAMAGELAGPGLAAVVRGEISLDEALLPTARPNLSLLPAGEMPVEQRPVVARSAELQQVIAQLAGRFDCLLLDVPALLASSDAIPLAALGDACLLVVRQGVTPVPDARLALDDVEHLPMLGVALNQVRIATPRWLLKFVPQE